MRAIREQVASAIDLIVHLSRLRDGSRRVTQVSEVNGMEGDVITLSDLFVFDYRAGIDDDGRFAGIDRAERDCGPASPTGSTTSGSSFPSELFDAERLRIVAGAKGATAVIAPHRRRLRVCRRARW